MGVRLEKDKAIPEGYMTVGEVAKKMGVTVRTLQYYDREGLITASAESAGGRRLYTDRDVIKLHQILSLKHLGFSLGDIKNRLIPLDTPEEVAGALAQQAAVIRKKIANLSASLNEIEALETEVLQMRSVDFKKVADIILNLQMKNEYYWMIKHIDDQALAYFRKNFDMDTGAALLEQFTRLNEEAVRLHKEGVPPESEEGLRFAEEFWGMIMEFTGGDMSLVSKLMETANVDGPDAGWKQKQEEANLFTGAALDAYFTMLKLDPLGEGRK